MIRWLSILILWAAFGFNLGATDAGWIRIDGAIGPATASYISRALTVAADRQDACLVVELNTPGGLLDSTWAIRQTFYSARIPVVVYVAPTGARAASAGCFITLAADVAAMAPHTTIGAAHPVQMATTGGSEKPDETMEKKLENDAVSAMEAIAQKRGRNSDWAKSSVRDSISTTAEEALQLKVIDLIAKDPADLFRQLDGRKVNELTLKTAGARVVEIPMIPREKLFQLLWRPEVMLVLMLAAIYGIIGELSNPGAILPGVVGGIALILALYMGAILPVNAAGVALIGLALVLFLIDAFAPTHGVLTFGGVVAFFLGALMLFDRNEPAFRLSLAYIIPATVLTASFFVFIVSAGLRAQFLPVRSGKELMIGRTVPALARIDARGGKVFIEGEYWNALSDTPIESGQVAEVVGIQGLTLRVKPKLG